MSIVTQKARAELREIISRSLAYELSIKLKDLPQPEHVRFNSYVESCDSQSDELLQRYEHGLREEELAKRISDNVLSGLISDSKYKKIISILVEILAIGFAISMGLIAFVFSTTPDLVAIELFSKVAFGISAIGYIVVWLYRLFGK